MDNKLTNINSAISAPLEADLLRIRKDAATFPRLRNIPEAEATAALCRLITQAMLYRGQKALVRCDRAGVFFGTLTDYDNGTAVIRGCRRIWYFNGAASLSELAVTGPKRGGNKFSVTVEDPCTYAGICNL